MAGYKGLGEELKRRRVSLPLRLCLGVFGRELRLGELGMRRFGLTSDVGWRGR